MKGDFGVLTLLDTYPVLWVPVVGFFAAAILGPGILHRIKSANRRAAALKYRLAAIKKSRKALLAHQDDPEFYYQYAQAYLHTLDPDQELPDRAALEDLIETVHLSDTIFHYNSVDWFAAHADPSEYERLIGGLRALSLHDLTGPVRDALDYKHRLDDGLGDADDSFLEAMSEDIKADYVRRAGVFRVRETVHEKLRPQMDRLLAARRRRVSLLPSVNARKSRCSALTDGLRPSPVPAPPVPRSHRRSD